MVAIARVVPVAVAVLAFLGSGTPLLAQESNVDAVKRVVRGESDAWFRRDSVGWTSAWVQDTGAVVMGVSSAGFGVNLGWAQFGPSTVEMMRNNPTPMTIKFDDINHRVRIDGALAFAEYDQAVSYPPDTTVLIARQHRVLVKRAGEWKIISSGVYLLNTFDASPSSVEARLSGTGNTLSRAMKTRDAIKVFKVNADLFPNSPRVYQSLGEAYATVGETKLAIGNYEKSLAIDPKNAVAKRALAKLRESKSP